MHLTGSRRIGRWVLLAAVAISLGLAVLAFAPIDPVERTASLRTIACSFPRELFRDVRCAYLRVPERRDHSETREIDLAVAIIAPDDMSQESTLPPIVYLEGGPGEGTGLDRASIDRWVRWRDYAPWLQERTLVLIDYRGTGLSEPKMDCPEIGPVDIWHWTRGIHDAKAALAWQEAALRCQIRLVEDGHVDLAAYDSVADASDIADLRRALGFAQWDIWASSYGTRVALNLMRIDEDGIRSAILDSAVPHEAPLFTGVAEGLQSATRRLQEGCRSQPRCAQAYGNIEEDLRMIVMRLGEEPVPIEPVVQGRPLQIVLTDQFALKLIYLGFYAQEDIEFLPMIIHETARGDYGWLENMAEPYLLGFLDPTNGVATEYSHHCREEIPFDPPEALLHPPAEGPFDGFDPSLKELSICEVWQAGTGDPSQRQPVKSDVPALILAGTYDAITPPSWARQLLPNLTNAELVEFPGIGHGVLGSEPCAVEVVGEFLDDPHERPQPTCLATLGPPAFLVLPGPEQP